jgi:hypothetical protein
MASELTEQPQHTEPTHDVGAATLAAWSAWLAANGQARQSQRLDYPQPTPVPVITTQLPQNENTPPS